MTIDELKKHAERIPSMGGRQIGDHIRKAVELLKPGQAVVELGTWMGAGTAQVAIALLEQGKDNRIYTYDRFKVSGRQVLKADREGLVLSHGQDAYPVVKRLLEPFSNITLIKSEIRNAPYCGYPIGLYIDDACKQKKNFDMAIKIFSHSFVAGETLLILMDFYLWKNTEDEGHKYQYNFMQEHANNFRHIKDIETSYWDSKEYGAIYLYTGGTVDV